MRTYLKAIPIFLDADFIIGFIFYTRQNAKDKSLVGQILIRGVDYDFTIRFVP